MSAVSTAGDREPGPDIQPDLSVGQQALSQEG